MMEKGFYVSPQQCEDKFNDLNKRYKRVNDILGKGTACKVVENQNLLDTMDLAPKMKEEVRKLLNSKHLFFREMCAYHNSCGHGVVANQSPETGIGIATEPSSQNVQNHVDMGDGDTGDSEDEYYKQVEQRRAAKLAAKAEMYSRISAVPPSSPETIDGKRHISYQMEKNRGLTRKRKKETKNPRKKYKEQHKKKVNRRKGQVQEIKKPTGPYGGEASGINVATSRSVRFKN
jgi:hypothetical protein